MPSPPELTQYVSGSNPLRMYIMMLNGLYTSTSPKRYPSYHFLTSSSFSGCP